MLPSVFGKVVHDQWRATLAWSVGASVLAAFYLALYPSLGGLAEMQTMLDAMPPELRAFFAGEGFDLATPAGYLNIELFSFVLPLVVAGYGVAVGSAAIAGEEERGTLDLLLANPVPRWRVVIEKSIAMLVGIVVLVGAIWIGLALTSVAMDIDLDLGLVASGLTSGALLGMVIGALALALGSITGRRTLSLAVAMVVLVVTYVINAMSALVEGLEAWRPISPVYHYVGYDPLNNGIDPAHASVLVAMTLVGIAVAVLAFERRDVRG
ncbi:MAG: ABC transporter permease [Chloroflexota bacterium]|jgi:ABC-2 type transport system permease protein|nr:ABC transporter permease [Chloroflexota bacterium]MDH5242618.1 ABC transporter permease [Chloroflexota bacterium]